MNDNDDVKAKNEISKKAAVKLNEWMGLVARFINKIIILITGEMEWREKNDGLYSTTFSLAHSGKHKYSNYLNSNRWCISDVVIELPAEYIESKTFETIIIIISSISSSKTSTTTTDTNEEEKWIRSPSTCEVASWSETHIDSLHSPRR